MPVERWTFVASGQAEVVKAYESIAAQAARTESKVNRSFKKQATGAKRAAKQTEQAWSQAKRPLNETEKLALKVARTQERAAKKVANAQIREAKRASAAQVREAKKVAAAQIREAKRVARSRRRTMGAIGGAALRGIGLAGAATGVVMGAAARQSVNLRDQSIALAVKGGGVSASAIQSRLQNQAIATPGVKAADLAGGLEAFVAKTGDLGLEFAGVMAEISVATGTSAADIGGAMADLYQKFDIKTVDGMASAMAKLAVQGKRGAFELEDAAAQFPKIAAAASKFGLKGAGGLATLGGMTQLARTATGSGENAATAVENMFAQLIKKSDVIEKKTGQKVFKDKGKTVTNDLTDILVGTISGAGGNLKTLEDIFGTRGVRAVSPLIQEYNAAYGRSEGTTEEKRTADAMAALRVRIRDAIDATGAEAEIKRDLAAMQEQTGNQLTAAWESLVAEVTGAATPAMGELAKTLSGFIRTSDMGGLAAAFMALVEATGLAVEGLQAIGLLKEKKPDKLADAAKRKAEATEGLKTLGASQKEGADELSRLVDVADLGGGMDPADMAARLAAIKVTPDQFAAYRKNKAKLAGADDVLFAGGQGRRSALDQLVETGMDPKEAVRRIQQATADPESAQGPGDLNIPLLGGLVEGVFGSKVAGAMAPTSGATDEQAQIIQNFASTLDQANSKAGEAAAENEKLAKAAAKAADELGKFQDRTSPSIFGKLF